MEPAQAPSDELSELALSEGIRALDEQQAQIASARTLAGLLVTTIGLVSGTLGVSVVGRMDRWPSAVVGVLGLVVLIGGAWSVVPALVPRKWKWTTNARTLLGWTTPTPRQDLAKHLATYADENKEKLDKIWENLRVAVILTVSAIPLLLIARGVA